MLRDSTTGAGWYCLFMFRWFFFGLMVNALTARKLRDFSGLENINQEAADARVES